MRKLAETRRLAIIAAGYMLALGLFWAYHAPAQFVTNPPVVTNLAASTWTTNPPTATNLSSSTWTTNPPAKTNLATSTWTTNPPVEAPFIIWKTPPYFQSAVFQGSNFLQGFKITNFILQSFFWTNTSAPRSGGIFELEAALTNDAWSVAGSVSCTGLVSSGQLKIPANFVFLQPAGAPLVTRVRFSYAGLYYSSWSVPRTNPVTWDQ